MTKQAATRYVKKLNERGYDEARVYEGYSGRGMYGSHTTGVVAPHGAESICPGLKKCAKDGMGLSVIFY